MKKLKIAILLILLAAAVMGLGYFVLQRVELAKAPDPAGVAAGYCEEIFSAMKKGDESSLLGENGVSDGRKMVISDMPETQEGKLLYNYCFESIGYELSESKRDGRSAQQSVNITYPVFDNFSDGINEKLNAALAALVAEAKKPSDIYDSNKQFKPEIVNEIYAELLAEKLKEESENATAMFTMQLSYSKGIWNIENKEEIKDGFLVWDRDFDSEAERIKSDAISELTYIPVPYKIEETALQGPVPDQNKFIVTKDPNEIAALLETEGAKNLIGDRKMLWSPEVESIPGRDMYCYLDDTIIVICWQQVEARAVGTYSEIIIADGSQLRRRIAGDAFEDFHHMTTTDFAKQCNGVLTMGGDFYHHGRNCGIIVYNRQVLRFDPSSCDTCYITTSGDMLFSYRDQFSSWEEAQKFVDENDVLFSLAFGPVLIDDYKDVTPDSYMWGEIHDHYARSGLGLFEDGHYLGININCEMPDYYYLVTLRDLADAMVRAGCRKAYTLDGGQTATTVFNQQLINPVQFGWEKPISDVIYFATAIPNE